MYFKMVSQKHFTTIYLYLTLFQKLRLEMHGAIPLLPIYAFMPQRGTTLAFTSTLHMAQEKCVDKEYDVCLCKLLHKPIERFSLNLKCMLGHWRLLSIYIFYTAFNPTIVQFNKK